MWAGFGGRPVGAGRPLCRMGRRAPRIDGGAEVVTRSLYITGRLCDPWPRQANSRRAAVRREQCSERKDARQSDPRRCCFSCRGERTSSARKVAPDGALSIAGRRDPRGRTAERE